MKLFHTCKYEPRFYCYLIIIMRLICSTAYLKEEVTECVREITGLSGQCATLAPLSYAAYAIGFKVVKVTMKHIAALPFLNNNWLAEMEIFC